MKTTTQAAIATLLILSPANAFAERSTSETGASHKMHQHMVQSSEKAKSMNMSGDVDKDFAKMMADHHRSGIEMAQMYVKHGKSDDLKELAEEDDRGATERFERSAPMHRAARASVRGARPLLASGRLPAALHHPR